MARTGFVLISCEVGFEKAIMKKLGDIKEVADVSLLSGSYDIIVKLESATLETLRELIVWKIRKIEKIRSIITLLSREMH